MIPRLYGDETGIYYQDDEGYEHRLNDAPQLYNLIRQVCTLYYKNKRAREVMDVVSLIGATDEVTKFFKKKLYPDLKGKKKRGRRKKKDEGDIINGTWVEEG